ncbi:putative DNA binding CopG/RHH family protein [Streptomyces phaeoluteigriseus]
MSLIRVVRERNVTRRPGPCRDPLAMGTDVLSLRIDHELLERLRHHAAKRGMSVQDYVVQTLIRDDFDERFQTAVEETEKFYGLA